MVVSVSSCTFYVFFTAQDDSPLSDVAFAMEIDFGGRILRACFLCLLELDSRGIDLRLGNSIVIYADGKVANVPLIR